MNLKSLVHREICEGMTGELIFVNPDANGTPDTNECFIRSTGPSKRTAQCFTRSRVIANLGLALQETFRKLEIRGQAEACHLWEDD
jgi:hypothetical protein